MSLASVVGADQTGKGLAVVAQEVRQLAQRSAKAASDIKILIQDSNGQVKDGVQLVNQALMALNEIVGAIGKVAGPGAEWQSRHRSVPVLAAEHEEGWSEF